jgi:hypothetical protein
MNIEPLIAYLKAASPPDRRALARGWTPKEIRKLLGSIDVSTEKGLRDAIILALVFKGRLKRMGKDGNRVLKWLEHNYVNTGDYGTGSHAIA